MILKFRILKKFIFILLSALALGGISACGKFSAPRFEKKNLDKLILAAQFSPDKIENQNFPAPDAIPVIKYTSTSTIFPNTGDIIWANDVPLTLQKLREISSATKEFQDDLLKIVNSTNSIDALHLELILDASYFPYESVIQMQSLLSDLNSCSHLPSSKCTERINQTNANWQLALKLGSQINQTLIAGVKKINDLDNNHAFSLLYRVYPENLISDEIFKSVLAQIKSLNSDEKLAYLELSFQKMAFMSASQLASDWFVNNSDKKTTSFIPLVSRFPEGDIRDQLMIKLISFIEDLPALEFEKIFALCSSPANKDLLINELINKTPNFDSDTAIEIIRLSTNKNQISESILNKIKNFTASDLIKITQNATYSTEREKIIAHNIYRINSFTIDEARAIADLSGNQAYDIVIALLPKISNLDGNGLTSIIQSINSGPGRDKALIAGIPNITSSDVNADILALNLAYNAKLQVASMMFAKTPHLAASDVALVAKNCLSDSVRDQILINGTNLISFTTLDGVIAVIGLSTQQKSTVALMNIARIPNVSTNDFGAILKTISDGTIRDNIIENGLGLIKEFSSEGAALIVERSFESKIQTATRLISLIPSPTGNDLDKMLAVCGSGNTRDQILANGIKLLNKLTKSEAKALYSRAYDDKEHVAILLMSKVDNIDGTTVGEIAMYSNKGSTRDLIINEGLKRLQKLDTLGLIAMLKASYKTTENLLMNATSRIENFGGADAISIAANITDFSLKDRFLIHAIDIINTLDEPTITQLALKASTQSAREEIVQKGIDKLGGTL